jgi:hypothetical protein
MVLVHLGLAVFAGLGARSLGAALTYLTPLPPFPRREGGRDRLSQDREGGSVLPSPPRRGAGGEVMRPLLRGLLLVGLVVLIMVEQQVAPLALTDLPATGDGIPAVYRWLAAHPDGGVLIEFPVGVGLRDPVVESTHLYYQTWHGHPLVNSYSSFRPPTYVEIFSRLDAQYNTFNAEQLGILQSLGARYLLYHEANYKRAAWQQVTRGLKQFPQVHEVGVFDSGRFGADHLYALDPRPPGVALQVSVLPGERGHARIQITNPYAFPLLTRLRPTLDLGEVNGRYLAVQTPLTLPPGTQTFTAPDPLSDAPTALIPLAPAPDCLAIGPAAGQR